MVQFLVGYGLGVEQGRPRPEDSQKPAATGGESLVYPLVEATDRFPASLWEQDSDSSCDAPPWASRQQPLREQSHRCLFATVGSTDAKRIPETMGGD